MDQQYIIDRIRRDMYGDGNGSGTTGLLAEHNRMYRDLYRDSETGEPGLIADVKAIRHETRIDREERRLFEAKLWTATKVGVAFVGLGVLTGVARVVSLWMSGS